MSQLLIRQALEQHLAAMPGALPTAYTNTAFAPVPGQAYQRCTLLPSEPDNSAQGTGMFFEIGTLQVTLCYPLGAGPAAAELMAQQLRAHFRRGTTLAAGTGPLALQVLVIRTPAVAPALLEPDRYCVPVSVRYQAQVHTPLTP